MLDENSIPNNLSLPASTEQAVLKSRASNLGLSPEVYSKFLLQAQTAYDWFKANGPFYGTKGEPSFRLSSEPISLPRTYLDQLQTLGEDLLVLDSSLERLPANAKTALGKDVVFSPELSWRLDIILDESGALNINEIQVDDGADALMIGEQLAYNLINLEQSTAAALDKAYREKLKVAPDQRLSLAAVWTSTNPQIDPYVSNARKMSEYFNLVSRGQTKLTLLRAKDDYNPTDFDGVINCCVPPSQLNFRSEQILSQTNFSAIDNKGLFVLLRAKELAESWKETLDNERYERLKKVFIPSRLIQDKNTLLEALNDENSVVKAYWANGDAELLQSGQGVFGPWNDFRKKREAQDMFTSGFKFLRQQLVTPVKIPALVLSTNGQTLKKVDWYNRICAKYVQGQLTAVEMTLGPYIVPTKIDCCFAPVVFN